MDTGADRDYLSTRVRDRLGLAKRESVINLKTVSESSIGMREISDIILESMDGSYKASVQDIMVGNFPNSESDVIPAKEDWSGMEHLKDKERVSFIWGKVFFKDALMSNAKDWGWQWHTRLRIWTQYWTILPNASHGCSLLLKCGCLVL